MRLLAALATAALEPPSAATALDVLCGRADDLRRLATQKLHAFPFCDVPTCWRRLHTDSSLLKAVFQIQRLAVVPRRTEAGEDADADTEIVHTLDMALIMSGAPGSGRRDAIEQLLEALQKAFSPAVAVGEEEGRDSTKNDDDSVPLSKRRKLDHGDLMGAAVVDTVQIRHPVRVYEEPPSLAAFQAHISGANTPLLLRGVITHWPALTSRPWRSAAYLLSRTNAGKRLVPIELGRSYVDAGWGQRIVPFREFLATHILSTSPSYPSLLSSSSSSSPSPSSPSSPRPSSSSSSTGYLAQHDLFAQIPALRRDIVVPDYCYTTPPAPPENVARPHPAELDVPLLNAWFGPRGTISPLHTDSYANVLAQVVGAKYVRLYAPAETPRLYPRGIEAGGVDMSNTSHVDVEAKMQDEWPDFAGAPYCETRLEAGECLYIPAGWWHYVRSLDVSFSVSFWWN